MVAPRRICYTGGAPSITESPVPAQPFAALAALLTVAPMTAALTTAALTTAALMTAAAPAGATPPAERVGIYVEAHGGVNLGGSDVGAEAEAGAAFGLKAGYRILPWLAAGAVAEFATLPAAGLPSGNFSFFGVEAAGILPTAHVELVLGLALGYDSARGTYGDYGGLPGVRLRGGVRVPVLDLLDLGLDYGLTLPAADDEVQVGGQTLHVDPAALHQLSVVAGVRF